MKKTIHKDFTYTQELCAVPGSVFPLLCPTREYEWIDVWRCELVHSRSGHAELDCLFVTDYPAHGRETWLVSRFEPPRCIEFARMGEHVAMRYRIDLYPMPRDRTLLAVHQAITSLSEEGAQRLARLDQAAYEQDMKPIWAKLDHFLKTGAMLPDAVARGERE